MASQEQAGKPPILLIIGADRQEQIERHLERLRVRGSSDIFGLLEASQPFHRLHLTPSFFRQQRSPRLSAYRCIINLITEPEQNGRVLEIAKKLLRNVPAKVLNRPEAVLQTSRDQVAKRLADIPGLWVPRTLKLRASKPAVAVQAIKKAGVPFPIILRQTATHTGDIVGRLDSLEEVEANLVEGSDHIATEFVDFRSADGLYRKYRVWFIGPHVVFRHMLISDHWNVHGRDRARFMADRPALVAEEVAMTASPDGAFASEVKQVFQDVRARMPLDFFGMDFGFAPDGRVLLFEANATMNFFSTLPGAQFTYLQDVVPPARAAFRELAGFGPA